MDQAKNWYRWATEKKRNARARGEMGKSPRTMGRRGLAGNLGQPNALEIYQAVYDENVAAAAAANARQRYSEANARANGWTTMRPLRTRTYNTQNTLGNMNVADMMSMSGVYGGKSHRSRTRKARKSSRRARTRAHRR